VQYVIHPGGGYVTDGTPTAVKNALVLGGADGAQLLNK